MKEHGMLFNGEMVRAILEGRKTQTRRVIKPQPEWAYEGSANLMWEGDCIFYDSAGTPSWRAPGVALDAECLCPYGQPGDRLWVREAWATVEDYDYLPPRLFGPLMVTGDWTPHTWYAADEDNSGGNINVCAYGCRGRTRPSRYMPRWASRINLEVVAVWVERVQEITSWNALAEGIKPIRDVTTVADDGDKYRLQIARKDDFIHLWDGINAKRGHGWDVNPWVWVVEFKRINNESEGK